MTAQEKQLILEKIKDWFRTIGISHIENTKKLKKLTDFNYNPFLISYLSYFHSGNCTPESIAKTLLFPRVLGTSIATSFGNHIQTLTHSLLGGYASGIQGMDIEFIDTRDGVRKYAQLKAGPTTINSKDVKPMIEEFDAFLRLARTNKLQVTNQNMAVCIVYGERWELSANYKKIEDRYEVLIGSEFWNALTGDNDFYYDLIDACAEIAFETNGKDVLDQVIETLAATGEVQKLAQKLSNRS